MGLKLLADQYTEEPLTQQLFEKVNTTALYMDKMLQKLLMVYDINTLAEPSQPVDFPALLNQLQNELEDEISRTDTVFKVSVATPETFQSYPTLLKIILYNLVENALRFHSPLDDSHHEVLVEVTQKAEITLICVRDNGRGIRQQYIPQIFDMYFRGHSDVEGNGLGLYIVKKALEKVGGEITVESGEQEGACFEVRLRCEQMVKT
jgi:signal transduction histidine kinase